MDDAQARTLLANERTRLEQLLAGHRADGAAVRADADERGDLGDGAERLTAEGTQEVLTDSLRERLDAVGRAEQRLEAGTYGQSVRSGRPIPDDRLEADPAAELLVDEAVPVT